MKYTFNVLLVVALVTASLAFATPSAMATSTQGHSTLSGVDSGGLATLDGTTATLGDTSAVLDAGTFGHCQLPGYDPSNGCS